MRSFLDGDGAGVRLRTDGSSGSSALASRMGLGWRLGPRLRRLPWMGRRLGRRLGRLSRLGRRLGLPRLGISRLQRRLPELRLGRGAGSVTGGAAGGIRIRSGMSAGTARTDSARTTDMASTIRLTAATWATLRPMADTGTVRQPVRGELRADLREQLHDVSELHDLVPDIHERDADHRGYSWSGGYPAVVNSYGSGFRTCGDCAASFSAPVSSDYVQTGYTSYSSGTPVSNAGVTKLRAPARRNVLTGLVTANRGQGVSPPCRRRHFHEEPW